MRDPLDVLVEKAAADAGAPFESKDLLKNKGYRWDAEGRAWNKVIYHDLLPTEMDWHKAEVYRGEFRGRLIDG